MYQNHLYAKFPLRMPNIMDIMRMTHTYRGDPIYQRILTMPIQTLTHIDSSKLYYCTYRLEEL